MLKVARSLTIILLFVLCLSSVSFATGVLNGVGVSTETSIEKVVPTTESNVDAVSELFKHTSVTEKDIERANKYIAPLAVVMNGIIAFLLGFTILALGFLTVLDLTCIAVPPVRGLLLGADGSVASSSMQGGGMMGSNGGMTGMTGMGGPSSGSGNQTPTQTTGIGRWVSDEALSCIQDFQSSRKNIILNYAKKRSFFLVMFSICVIVFSTTVFTDLGIRIGMYLIQVISNIL